MGVSLYQPKKTDDDHDRESAWGITLTGYKPRANL